MAVGLQTWSRQSAAAPQNLPVAQVAPQLPPQSTSVSSPFLTASLQAAAWQTLPHADDARAVGPDPAGVPGRAGRAAVAAAVHVRLGRVLTPSVQLAGRQMPPLQTRLRQSPLVAADLAVEAPGRSAPPQSRSVSSPFFTPSSHAGAAHVPSQTPLTQSAPIAQTAPFAHGPQSPPQSTAVSLPSSAPSAQPSVVPGLEQASESARMDERAKAARRGKAGALDVCIHAECPVTDGACKPSGACY